MYRNALQAHSIQIHGVCNNYFHVLIYPLTYSPKDLKEYKI